MAGGRKTGHVRLIQVNAPPLSIKYGPNTEKRHTVSPFQAGRDKKDRQRDKHTDLLDPPVFITELQELRRQDEG